MLPPWSYQDGGWCQGTDYWQYSTMTNHEFMDVLVLGGIIDLYKQAWVQNEYLWTLYAYPNGSYGSFGDQNQLVAGDGAEGMDPRTTGGKKSAVFKNVGFFHFL